MLPQTLQRAIGPAVSLLRQLAQCLRRFRPTDGSFFITDLIAKLSNLQRQVLVFGEGVGAKAATLLDQFPAPRAHGAWHDRDAIQAGKCAPVHVLRGDVLQSLPTRDDVDAE